MMTTSRQELKTSNRTSINKTLKSNQDAPNRSKTPVSTLSKTFASPPVVNASSNSSSTPASSSRHSSSGNSFNNASINNSNSTRDITFSDLCLNDKKRLREMLLTIERQVQEIQNAEKRLEEEKCISSDRIDKLKKQNETLIKQTNSLKTKTNQNAIMLRTYQTKIEQLIEENVDTKKRFEEEKSILQNELDTVRKTVAELQEQNSLMRDELAKTKEIMSKKPDMVHQSIQTVSLQVVPQTLNESLKKTKKTEEALEREFQNYLSTHNLMGLSASGSGSGENNIVENSQIEELSDDSDGDDQSDLTDGDIDLAFAKYIEQSKLFSTRKQQIPDNEELDEQNSTGSDSEEEKSIFSEDSLFDVVQILEEQQNYERLSLERQSIDTLSQFNLIDSKEQMTGPLWFKNEDGS